MNDDHDDLARLLTATELPSLGVQPSSIVLDVDRRRTRRGFVIGGSLTALAAAGIVVVNVQGGGTGVVPQDDYDFASGRLGDLVCDARSTFESGSVLYDGSPQSDARTPLARIDDMLSAGFLVRPSGTVVVDDSGLTEHGGTVLVGSPQDGTTATVSFVPYGATSLRVETIRQCTALTEPGRRPPG